MTHNLASSETTLTRYKLHGPEHLLDIDYLELLLKRTVRKDPRSLARNLLAQFGGIAETLNASRSTLRKARVSNSTIDDLLLLQALPERVLRGAIDNRQILSTQREVLEYCRAAMAFKAIENSRILFLSSKHHLIADELQHTGTINHVVIYPRQVMLRALELNAKAILLVHNHPSGDPTPSRSDIDMTLVLKSAGALLNIDVVDHLIVGKEGYSSMRELRLL